MEPKITEKQALAMAAEINASLPADLREIGCVVAVRDKETGRISLMDLWNDEEIDKRRKLLQDRLGGAEDWYIDAVSQVEEHTALRRARWEQVKENLEIIVPSKP